MQRTILSLTVLILSSSSVFAQKAERKHVREGNDLYKSEKFTESEIEYRKALEVNPRSIEGTYNLGNSLYRQKKFPEAAEQYQLLAGQAERLKETPEGKQRLSEVYHNMGNIFMNGKDYAKSVEAYKESLRLNPKDDETRYNLALAQKMLKDQQQNQKEEQNQSQQQQQQQNSDQNQKEQENQKQNQQQQSKAEEKENQMSRENAEQLLRSVMQDEENTQDKVKKQQIIQGGRLEKDW